MYMGRSEGSLQESVLCFYQVGPGCQTQVIRLQVPLSTCRLPEGFICVCVCAHAHAAKAAKVALGVFLSRSPLFSVYSSCLYMCT